MAILRYSGADEVDPTTNQITSTMPLDETNLHALGATAVAGAAEQGGADVDLELNVAFDADALQFTINDVAYTPPTFSVLLHILSGAKTAQELLPSGSIYTLARNQTVEVSIPAGAAGGPHPLHLHGHVFDVVRSAGSDVYNYVNPVKRDVASIGADNDNITIRFATDNPGPWILHCHIDWHLDPNNTATANVETSAWDELCPPYDSLTADQL